MKVLYLGYPDSKVVNTIQREGDHLVHSEAPLALSNVVENQFEFLVSFGYKHIIRPPVLNYLKNKCINLHISYLPWNRGSHPNFWSFLENTPKGVTIHRIDEGIDTGDILLQKSVEFRQFETLATSYSILIREIENLFDANWELLKTNQLPARTQSGHGSLHYKKDLRAYEHLLVNGWDTHVSELANKDTRKGPA